MKIKLLNDGGYDDMENVNFPVEVDAVEYKDGSDVDGYDVLGSELIRVGANEDGFEPDIEYYFVRVIEAVAV